MDDPKKKLPFWERDLFELAGLNPLRERLRVFRILRLACNGRIKALLYRELAEAAARETPMEVALALCAEDFEGPAIDAFAARLLRLGRRSERAAAVLARRLERYVLSGHSLSDAMRKYPSIFHAEEVRIVQAGESWSRLPEALRRLSQFQMAEGRLADMRHFLAYPIVLAVILMSLLSFILVTIVPKFEDIFRQLGADALPTLTHQLIRAGDIVAHQIHVIVLLLVALFLFRKRAFRVLFATAPTIRRTNAEARWMAALALGLEAGVAPHEAMRVAAEISGGFMGVRARKAADRVERGISVGQACIDEKVLRPALNHRLALLDWQGDFIKGLVHVADDASDRAGRAILRLATLLEPLCVISLGVVMAFVIVALYLPMFSIPKLIP
jgi:type IV pilus assembly protein PilC